MSGMVDRVDRQLLDRVQASVPLVGRPFLAIGEELGLPEADLLQRLRRLKGPPNPLIRQISAIFDSAAIGYTSTLVAARVDEQRIAQAAGIISAHPGVSHNYRRNHVYNLWYTLTVPPDSRIGLQRTIDILHAQSGAIETRMMPAIRLFKIGVKFRMGEEAAEPATAPPPPRPHGHALAPPPLDEHVKSMIRVLQQDLPLESTPFDDWARQAGAEVDDLLRMAEHFRACGWMRRFSAVLHHRQAGFSANAMGVWIVPQEQIEQFGATAAGFDEVSHCYQRPTYPDWPYNLFTMVHGASREQCESVLARISEATGIRDYGSLYSTHEYKKIRVKYFTGDIEQWEREHASVH
jgi:siroheme decarboxylase